MIPLESLKLNHAITPIKNKMTIKRGDFRKGYFQRENYSNEFKGKMKKGYFRKSENYDEFISKKNKTKAIIYGFISAVALFTSIDDLSDGNYLGAKIAGGVFVLTGLISYLCFKEYKRNKEKTKNLEDKLDKNF